MTTYIGEMELNQLRAELEAYRTGGLTEEILRRKDGYIKVGVGCLLISNKTLEAWRTTIESLTEQLEKSTAEINRLVTKAKPVGDLAARAEAAIGAANRALYSGLPDGSTGGAPAPAAAAASVESGASGV